MTAGRNGEICVVKRQKSDIIRVERENVYMRDETKIDLYAASAISREYDEACKRIFRNKEIIAPIMQMVVPEYKNCTVAEVMRCIDSDTMEEIPVEDVPAKIEGLPTELSSVTEKLIRYDVHFKSVNPRLTNTHICVHLHIDLEVDRKSVV